MLRRHLQINFKANWEQVPGRQGNGVNHCARTSRPANLAAQKNPRKNVNIRDKPVRKRREITVKRRETARKRRELVYTRRLTVRKHRVLANQRREITVKRRETVSKRRELVYTRRLTVRKRRVLVNPRREITVTRRETVRKREEITASRRKPPSRVRWKTTTRPCFGCMPMQRN